MIEAKNQGITINSSIFFTHLLSHIKSVITSYSSVSKNMSQIHKLSFISTTLRTTSISCMLDEPLNYIICASVFKNE